MPEIILIPCPFCGGEPKLCDNAHDRMIFDDDGAIVDEIFEEADTYWVECTECYAMSSGKNSVEDAAAAWNRRAAIPVKVTFG